MEMQSTVRVPLTVEKRADIGDKLASLVERIKGVKAEAKSKAFAYRAEIEGLQEEQERLAAEMILGLEEKSQMDLFADEAAAAKALHDVAAAACTCEGGPEAEVHSPSCPTHGVDSRGPNAASCDGAHGQDVDCKDARCWLVVGAEEWAKDPSPFPVGEKPVVEELAEMLDAATAQEQPVGEQVDVGTVAEPSAVTEFHEAKARRKRA